MSGRLRPYKTVDNRIDGVVMVLLDVDATKRGAEHSAFVERPLVVLDGRLCIRAANGRFHELFHTSAADVANRPLIEVGGGVLDGAELTQFLRRLIDAKGPLDDVELAQEVRGKANERFVVSACRLPSATEPLVLLSVARPVRPGLAAPPRAE